MEGFVNEVVLILVLIVINGFLAMSEIALVTIRPLRLRTLAKKGNERAARTLRLVKDSSRFLSTIQIGITFAGFLASASAAVTLARPLARVLSDVPVPFIAAQSSGIAVFVTTAIISYLSLVFGELVPKQLALRWTESISLFVARPIEALGWLTYPIVRFLSWSTNIVLRLAGAPRVGREQRVTEEEIKQLVNEHKHIEEREKQMIEGVFEFGDAVVREIMVPRTDIVSIPEDTTIREALGVIMPSGFSRFPAIKGSIDNITGTIHARDLIPYVNEGKTDVSVRDLLRPAYFVPESKKALDLLKEMQQKGIHMAIVVDEYGGSAGLVTMENLVEQIVGSIQDEYDVEEADIQQTDKDHYIVKGDADIGHLNRELNLKLPESAEYETIAGYILDQLEYIPKAGEQLEHDDWVITVSEVKQRRITQVTLIRKSVENQQRPKNEE